MLLFVNSNSCLCSVAEGPARSVAWSGSVRLANVERKAALMLRKQQGNKVIPCVTNIILSVAAAQGGAAAIREKQRTCHMRAIRQKKAATSQHLPGNNARYPLENIPKSGTMGCAAQVDPVGHIQGRLLLRKYFAAS